MAKRGRPTKFDPQVCRQAERLCKLGATDAELADFFQVNEDTIYSWKKDHPEFSEALKKGKTLADATVADRLYMRATGYRHLAFKMFVHEGKVLTKRYVEHYPPDTGAAIFWLKNRRPDLWRDRVEHTGKDGGPIETREVGDDDLARWLAFEATRNVVSRAKAKARASA